MNAMHPESLLTRRERLVIAIAIPAVAVLTRLTIALLAAAFYGHPLRDELVALSITVAMFVPFPLAVSAMVRAVAMRRRGMEIAVLVVFSFIGALTSHLWRWGIMPGRPEDFLRLGWIHFRLFAPAVGVFLSLTAYFIAAIHQHRIAIAEDARRFETEAESARRARQSIERQMTPGLIVTLLQSVASRLRSNPDSAERLLLRLARHQRLLLQKAPADFEDEMRRAGNAIAMIRPDVRVVIRGSGSSPGLEAGHRFLVRFQTGLLNGSPVEMSVETSTSANEVVVRFKTTRGEPLPASVRDAFADSGLVMTDGEDASMSVHLPLDAAPSPSAYAEEAAVTAIPSLPVVYPLLVYLAAVVEYDLQGIDWGQMQWNSAVMTLVSATCWLFIGPLLHRVVRATVALRLPLAIAVALSSVSMAALCVTTVSAWFLLAVANEGALNLFGRNLSIMAWRNSLPALVIGASSLMTAYSGVMIAARAAAARARNETVRAETRALEDRFHPHFLFNALNSIAAFIRVDQPAAARMCLQLSSLVERTVACAGDRAWPVERELDLIDEYLSIQRIRFGDRLAIEHWDVPRDVRKRSIPRLILQPLLENIFKHAVAASARPIHAGLTIRKRGRGIEIFLWNSTAGIAAAPRFGRGLAFVSGRVRDAEGTLTVDSGATDGRFAIRCYIPPPL